MLHGYASGNDETPVLPVQEDAKSISNGFTFRHDLVGRAECSIGIEYVSEEIGRRLRTHGLKCATVSLTIKDENLRSIQRQRPQKPPTDLSREIAKTAYSILVDTWDESKPIRMITISATNLSKGYAEQMDLFAEDSEATREKGKKRENAVDKIRQKYGNESIVNGAILDTDIGVYNSKNKKTGK